MRGFTLVEVMITLLVLGVLCGALIVIFVAGKDSYDAGIASADLQASTRQALEVLAREVRQADLDSLAITAGERITFEIPTDISTTPATMSSLVAYYVTENQLRREHPAGSIRSVAPDISRALFSLNDDMLTVVLEASKTVRQRNYTLELTQQIRIRN